MHVRYAFTWTSVAIVLAGVSAPQRVLAADDKEACLSAADQGQSLRDDGRYVAARDQFVICARNVCPKLVHDQCIDWLRQLDESMPTVLFRVKDDQGNEVLSAHVTADGKPLSIGSEGKPVSLDPGPHDVRFERDNPSQSVSVHVVLRAGEKGREVNAAFSPAVEAPPEKPEDRPTPPPPPPPPVMETQEAPEPAPSFGRGRSIASLSLVAAGAASVGLGVYFGLQSQSEASRADGIAKALPSSGACGPGGNPADPRCKSLGDSRDAQNRDAALDIALYIGGGALAAGAVATWLLWPRGHGEPKASSAWIVPEFGIDRVGVRVGRTF